MHPFRRLLTLGLILAGLPLATEGALSRQNNLLGKFFVSSVNGAVTCVSDGRILELKKGDTIIARGAILETGEKSNVTLVFSNGTGVYTDEKTRFEIEKFDQEFFAPNNNLRVEPSNSSTIVKLATGRVVISTPRLLSGTTMVYETAHAMVGIRGEKLLIEATEKQTHVAIIGGNATVNPRGADGQFVSIGKRLVTGQEAFVKYTLGGQAITEEEFVASSGGEASAASSPSTSAPAAAPAPITRQVEAVVLRLTGSARVKLPADPREHDLAEGEKLPQGTLLRTGETDEVHLQPFEGAIATVRPNSMVHLEKLSVTDEAGVTTKQSALLALTAGTIISTIDPAKKDINDYGVRTPKGIANAKGTSFAVSVEDEGFSVTTTADTVTFVTPEGVTYSIAAGNVSITPPGGEPQPPVSLVDAMAGNSGFAQVVQTALSTVATVVQNNLGSLSPSSATDLLTKVAHTATAALPGEATAIATKVVAAVTWPASATSSQSAAAVAAVTSAIVAAAPDQAAQIATSAALAAPTQAVAVSAGAAKSSPGQAAQIASAVTQTFVQTTPDGDVSPASVQTAAAVAAAVTNSAPNQAAPIAAAVMQALAQAAPLSTPLSNSQHAATIASAVPNAAPPQAVPVAAGMMKTLTQ
ncbi:MAG TPA: FecR domain-containing protein, partial [Opitutus sp.]|nr:FecR domain-containing protein [Opitutus sp.]